MKLSTIIVLSIILPSIISSNTKYSKWQQEGYFRGYNILYETPKNLQDFIDFKNYGGNLFQISTDGFYNEDPPYQIMNNNISGTDQLVNYCRETGIYYVIAVRTGPGAYDTYEESNKLKPESRVWENLAEQTKYAEMLKLMVDRYDEDTLFAGINLMVEPRPKVQHIPANTSEAYKYLLENAFNIHMDLVYQMWVNEIRTINSTLPVILENFGYSTAELFPGYDVEDPFIIYSAHLYMPREYTHAKDAFTLTYPGTYFNLTYLSQQFYDRNFLKNVVLSKVKEYQESSGNPVMLGEFGMILPQTGGELFLNDVLSICNENGWHFALWDWRRGNGQEWNIESFEGDSNSHWISVLSNFHAPPVPSIISPVKFAYIDAAPVFKWNKLTAFTLFDLQIKSDSEIIFEKTGIKDSIYTYTEGNLEEGIIYTWRMRSRNPGSRLQSASNWTEERQMYIPVPDKADIVNNELKISNYPNPFNPKTIIKISIPEKISNGKPFVKLQVYNSAGMLMDELINNELKAGEYNLKWPSDKRTLPSGVYYYTLILENKLQKTGRMLLVK